MSTSEAIEGREILNAEAGTVALCCVVGCGRAFLAKGLCPMHYGRLRRNGSPHAIKNAPAGYGTVRPDGYRAFRVGGRETLEHRMLAESALGRPLPAGAEVHHIDLSRENNGRCNLVVCPNRAYHQLLHQRQRALDACGNASWLKCAHCKRYDDPSQMVSSTNRRGCTNNYHAQCKRDTERARYHARKESK